MYAVENMSFYSIFATLHGVMRDLLVDLYLRYLKFVSYKLSAEP